jgi:hypothetical protein
MTEDMNAWGVEGVWAFSRKYAQAPAPKTIEELSSELEAVKQSHVRGQRALENMAISLSDAMDRSVVLEEAARKTKLAYDKSVVELEKVIEKQDQDLASMRARIETAEKAASVLTKKRDERAEKQKSVDEEQKP